MGVEYDLNDPQKGESFDFGKGWIGFEDSEDYAPSPTAYPSPGPGWERATSDGGPYKWTPLTSREATLAYVTSRFWFLRYEEHSDGCMHTNTPSTPPRPWKCALGCPFNDPDLEYANAFADTLWKWLDGRDQSQLDVTNDASSDDMHCRGGEDHDDSCARAPEWGVRHFFVTGSRYLEDSTRLAKAPTPNKVEI